MAGGVVYALLGVAVLTLVAVCVFRRVDVDAWDLVAVGCLGVHFVAMGIVASRAGEALLRRDILRDEVRALRDAIGSAP